MLMLAHFAIVSKSDHLIVALRRLYEGIRPGGIKTRAR